MLKLLILTSGGGGTAVLCLPELVGLSDVQVVGVVRSRGMNPATKARRRRKKLRKILQIGVLGAVNGIRIRKWFHADHGSLESVCAEASVPLHDVPYIGSTETVALVKSFEADLGLSLGNTFIPQKVYSIPRYGMLNCHCFRNTRTRRV
jgi:methionyl-tRNA formyltransferase